MCIRDRNKEGCVAAAAKLAASAAAVSAAGANVAENAEQQPLVRVGV